MVRLAGALIADRTSCLLDQQFIGVGSVASAVSMKDTPASTARRSAIPPSGRGSRRAGESHCAIADATNLKVAADSDRCSCHLELP